MLELFRGGVCTPLTMKCNLNCKYCFQNNDRNKKLPDISEDMGKYIESLDAVKCKHVYATGGEPLLVFDKVKELFSHVPEGIVKKIISNGTLLTQEIVDYINENDILFQITHNGPKTKFLCGVDILDDDKLVNLLRQIKHLRVTCVMTKYNVDMWENYFDTVTRLGRKDIEYTGLPVMDFNCSEDLVSGFDYEKWFETWSQFKSSPLCHDVTRKKIQRQYRFHILGDGRICMFTQVDADYGSIYQDGPLDISKEKVRKAGMLDYCAKTGCKFKDTCRFSADGLSDHICKCRRMIMSRMNPEKRKELREYVVNHWDEIKAKYGYIE